MRAAEFHDAFRRLGEAALASEGFVYKDKSWHHTIPDQLQLSFCPQDTKFGHGFSVRYLTVALWHLEVEPPAGFNWLALRNTCGSCPVKISPALLGPHVESGFSEEVWACPDPLSFETHLGTCLPVYFGGEDLWVLADRTAAPEANRQALLHTLKKDGVRDLSETTALETVEQAVAAVARYGLAWAEGMTVERAAPLVIRAAKSSDDLAIHYYAPQYAKAIGA